MPNRQASSRGPVSPPVVPREAQRRRTREAIVAATQRLLVAGTASPSVDDVAAEAEVSRRTIYLYFPTLDQLLLDAAVGLLSSKKVDRALARAATDPDERRGVQSALRAIIEQSAATLDTGRQIVRLTVQAAPGNTMPRRGYRRVGWLEQALAPLAEQLGPAGVDRLVSALTVLVGWEALIVLHDVRGRNGAAAIEEATWLAGVVVDAALAASR